MSAHSSPYTVLVADDQIDILRAAKMLFKSEGIHCVTCERPSEALGLLKKHHIDLALIDLNYQRDTTSGAEGLALIENIQALNANLPIMVMTAWATVDVAVEAMKLGACDFITKPWDVDRLLNLVKTHISLYRAMQKQEQAAPQEVSQSQNNTSQWVYESAAMKKIQQMLSHIAKSDASVLITGENGTGKTQLASYCHAMSHRAAKPFVSVNMGALAENVFESEIFGHEKGAFTGADSQRIGRYEMADGGTLFLDEIANISEKQQATLLRVLETGQFERVGSSKTRSADVRILCATNDALLQSVAEGRFRQDLYYRICTVPIHIPPLRERRDDIVPLAQHFIASFSEKYQKPNVGLAPCAEAVLIDYTWLGNVRELAHTIERAILLTSNNEIKAADLVLMAAQQPAVAASSNGVNLEECTLEDMEYQMLDAALTKYMRKPDEAAKALGISRSAFYRKLAKHGFDLT